MVHSSQEAVIPVVDDGQIACHTPGPWKACGTIYEHMNCEIRSGAKGEGQGIAQVWDGPNAFKDGQLMAAAPDMLAVLQEMFCDGPVQVAFAGNPTAIEALEARARAAIARATGAA